MEISRERPLTNLLSNNNIGKNIHVYIFINVYTANIELKKPSGPGSETIKIRGKINDTRNAYSEDFTGNIGSDIAGPCNQAYCSL